MNYFQVKCCRTGQTSAGHQYISWAPVHQLGTSTSAGHQYISWAPVHQLGTSTSAGHQYISWAPVHQLGTSTSAGHQYISWAPVHQLGTSTSAGHQCISWAPLSSPQPGIKLAFSMLGRYSPHILALVQTELFCIKEFNYNSSSI